MDTPNEEGLVDSGSGDGQPKFVYVRVGASDGRVMIEDQDERMVLDFLKDDKIANKLACYMNLGIIKGGSHGIPEDPNTVRA